MSAPDYQFAVDAEAIHVAASGPPAPSVQADTDGCGTAISTRGIRTLLSLCEGLAEFSAAAVAVFAAYRLCFSLRPGSQLLFAGHEALGASVCTGILILLSLPADHARCAMGSPLQIRETERAMQVSAQTMIVLMPVNYFFHLGLSAVVFFIALILVSILLILERHLFIAALRFLHAKGIGAERVVIYAGAKTGRRVASFLLYSPRLGQLPVAVIDAGLPEAEDYNSGHAFPRLLGLPMYRGPLTPARLQNLRCDLLVVDIASHSAEKLAGITGAANQAGCRVAIVSVPSTLPSQSMEWLRAGGRLFQGITSENLSWCYVFAKRTVDILLSFTLLIVLAPLLAVIALLVRLDSPGPSLFIQKRVGLHGRLFDIYKFRSMHVGVPRYELSPATSRDRRITRIGRWLRRTSLDELPQLFNVLLGSMSLVGPRPEMPFLVERHIERHSLRLQAKPGITGLWQLSSARAAQIHENPEYDHYYIHNRSCCLDFAILLHTLLFAVRGI